MKKQGMVTVVYIIVYWHQKGQNAVPIFREIVVGDLVSNRKHFHSGHLTFRAGVHSVQIHPVLRSTARHGAWYGLPICKNLGLAIRRSWFPLRLRAKSSKTSFN